MVQCLCHTNKPAIHYDSHCETKTRLKADDALSSWLLAASLCKQLPTSVNICTERTASSSSSATAILHASAINGLSTLKFVNYTAQHLPLNFLSELKMTMVTHFLPCNVPPIHRECGKMWPEKAISVTHANCHKKTQICEYCFDITYHLIVWPTNAGTV